MNNSALDLLVFDLLLEILEILNPFRKNDPFTELECAVIVAQFDDGVTTLEPLAMRTDKTTIVGHGEVDLNTEKLDLDWAAKPRKGLGMSANAITKDQYCQVSHSPLLDPNRLFPFLASNPHVQSAPSPLQSGRS